MQAYRWSDLPIEDNTREEKRRDRRARRRNWVVAATLIAACAIGLASWAHGMEGRTIARVERETEGARGLRAARPVPVTLLAPDAFRRLIHEADDGPATVASRRRLGRAYALLGLILPGTDLARLLDRRSQSQVIGLYIPARHGLYVEAQPDHAVLGLGHDLSLYDQGTLAHEYTHALQDQTFGWRHIVGPPDRGPIHDTDRDLAMDAVIEGDAEETRIEQAEHNLSAAQIDDLNQQIERRYHEAQAAAAPLHIPPVVTDVARFPYDQGRRYVHNRVVDNGGSFATVDAMYRARSFPCSTWLIMQDTGLIYDDEPNTSGCDTVPVPAPPDPAGWTLRDSDVVGALRLHAIDGGLATRWDADRYAIYTRGDETVLIWHVRVRLLASTTASVLAQHADNSFGAHLPREIFGRCYESASVGARAAAAVVYPADTGDAYLAVSLNPASQSLVARAAHVASGCP